MSRTRWLTVCMVAAALALGAFLHAGRALAVTRAIGSPDAIIVLASHEWERLPLAARLARTHPHAVILLTTPLKVTASNCHRCADRVRLLTQTGIPVERVLVLQERVRNTHDEAAAARAYARMHRIGSLLVVTSPYHGRRALSTFRAAFRRSRVQVGLVSAASLARANPARWWMTPHERWYVGYEWAALAWYALTLGINPLT
jgi:uncharacterized SAM-binding protein YcdF (DUF218 family)